MLKRILAQSLLALAACLLATQPSAQAQAPLNYEFGDLLMGVRATAGDGAPKCYIVNIGQASTFTGAASAFTVMNLGNIATDLNVTFPGWQNDGAVLWSVSGAIGNFDAVGNDPAKTLYATKVQAVPGTPNAVRWTRGSSSTHTVVSSKMDGLADGYEFVNADEIGAVKNTSTANSTKARLQNTTDPNSYASYQPGGTAANSGPPPGISFAQFNPTVEATFANGTANSILELYRLLPGSAGTQGEFVGTFKLDDSANLTFTPAPVAPKPEVKFSSATYSGSETGGTITLTLLRTGDMSGSFTVNFSTADGSALAGTDYTAQTNVPVNFTASDTSKTVMVAVQNRAGFQGDRTFTATLSNATNDGQILTPSTATVTILEADTGVQFENPTYTVSETGTNVVVKLVRVGAAAAFTATVNTTDGTASAGTDYTGQPNVGVDFLTSDSEKTLSIPIANRTGLQGDRDFDVTITGTTNGVVIGSPASTEVTIEDLVNAGTVAFSSATYSQAEPATGTVALTITVNRSGGTDGVVSVDVDVTGGTAQSPDDYTVPADPVVLSWNEGETGARTFDITIKADAVSEANAETILLALQNAQGGVALGTPNTATVTLPGEDSTAPTLTVTAPKANAKFTAGFVTFTGTATDTVRVARVQVSLNNGAIVEETVNAGAASPFNWTLPVIAEQGLNNAVVTAFDAAGNPSTPVMLSFTFTNSRPQLAGKYNGLLISTIGIAAVDLFTRNGLVNVTVTATGKFTGKVTIAGVTLPISGTFLTGDGTTAQARFGKTLTPTFDLIKKAKPANITLGTLALAISTNGGLEVTGTLKTGATTLANISADLAVYTSKKNPVLPLKNVPITLLDPTREKGKYTGALLPDTIVAGTPAGNGYGTISISTSGVVKFVGKAADGSSISYSNTLSTDNRWPVFVQLYSKQGFVAGEVAFANLAETDAAGELTWFKPAALPKQALYPGGWPNGIVSNLIASKYLVPTAPTTRNPNPPNPATALGPGVPGAANTSTANIEVELNDGALATDTSNDASLDAKSKVTVLGATAGATAANGLKVAFATKSGAMSGTFTHPGQPKPLKLAGVAFQKTGKAYGHFLFIPKTPAVAEAGGVFVEEK